MTEFYINFVSTTITSATFETFGIFQFPLFFGTGISDFYKELDKWELKEKTAPLEFPLLYEIS